MGGASYFAIVGKQQFDFVLDFAVDVDVSMGLGKRSAFLLGASSDKILEGVVRLGYVCHYCSMGILLCQITALLI